MSAGRRGARLRRWPSELSVMLVLTGAAVTLIAVVGTILGVALLKAWWAL